MGNLLILVNFLSGYFFLISGRRIVVDMAKLFSIEKN